MKVFVTGATGFVGKNVVRQLVEKGHRVKVLIHSAPMPPEWEKQGIERVQGSIGDPAGWLEALKGCDAVIHLVGIIAEKGEQTFDRVHFEGTRNVIDAALQAGISRYVHMSALGARPSATSRYHVTKFLAEELALNAPIIQTIFRPSVMFGPESEFCAQMIKLVRNPFVVPVITSHNGRLQPIDVQEVAHCFVDCLEREETYYQTYELGGPAMYTMPELMETFANALGLKPRFVGIPAELLTFPASLMNRWLSNPPITPDQLIMLQENNTCDIRPILEVFGVPKKTLEEGIRESFAPPAGKTAA